MVSVLMQIAEVEESAWRFPGHVRGQRTWALSTLFLSEPDNVLVYGREA